MTFVVSQRSVAHIPFGAPDYVAHAVSYAVCGALVVRALAGGALTKMTPVLIFPAVAFGTFYGVTDEFHQWFVPGRVASGTDLVADAFGSLLGAVAAVAVGTLVRAVRRRRSGGYNRD